MTNKEKIDNWFKNSAGKTRGHIPHEIVLRWLDEKDDEAVEREMKILDNITVARRRLP